MTDHHLEVPKQSCSCFFSDTQIASHSECTSIPCTDRLHPTDDVIIGADDKFRLNSGCSLTQVFDFEKCLSIRCSRSKGEPCDCKKKDPDDDQKWYTEKILPVQVVITEFNRNQKCKEETVQEEKEGFFEWFF